MCRSIPTMPCLRYRTCSLCIFDLLSACMAACSTLFVKKFSCVLQGMVCNGRAEGRICQNNLCQAGTYGMTTRPREPCRKHNSATFVDKRARTIEERSGCGVMPHSHIGNRMLPHSRCRCAWKILALRKNVTRKGRAGKEPHAYEL